MSMNPNWLLKLKEFKAKDRREVFGTAEFRFMSLLLTQDPEEQLPVSATDVVEKVQSIFQDKKIIEVDHVKDNQKFYFGPFGLIVGARERVPLSIEWFLNVMESDKDIRNFAEACDKVMEDKLLLNAAEQALRLLSTNPLVPVVYTIAVRAMKQLCYLLRCNKDDQVALFDITAAQWCDYAYGDCVMNDVVDLTGNGCLSAAMFTNPAIKEG